MVRLIDADEIRWADHYDSDGNLSKYKVAFSDEMPPTVDAVPVRHGKWIHEVRYTIDSLHSYQQYRCSECGMTYITHTKYCPNCGARMDEE